MKKKLPSFLVLIATSLFLLGPGSARAEIQLFGCSAATYCTFAELATGEIRTDYLRAGNFITQDLSPEAQAQLKVTPVETGFGELSLYFSPLDPSGPNPFTAAAFGSIEFFYDVTSLVGQPINQVGMTAGFGQSQSPGSIVKFLEPEGPTIELVCFAPPGNCPGTVLQGNRSGFGVGGFTVNDIIGSGTLLTQTFATPLGPGSATGIVLAQRFAVPEPASAAVMALGLAGLLAARRRRV